MPTNIASTSSSATNTVSHTGGRFSSPYRSSSELAQTMPPAVAPKHCRIRTCDTGPRGDMKHRHRILILLVLLFAITHLDRVRMSVARPRIQRDRPHRPHRPGMVTSIFTLSYCLFEIPIRRVLTRIVLWWSWSQYGRSRRHEQPTVRFPPGHTA
jgi:hypothetical protein